MSCKKLYLENMDCMQVTACVIGCTARSDGSYDIETDVTPLFPEGGGQRSDIGMMNDADILHCREENGTVIHQVTSAFAVDETVEIRVNAPLRRLHTQQHTGEHILSFAYQKLFGAVNVGFHMSEDVVTIDLDRMLTPEQVAEGELYANELLWNNGEVKIYTVTAEEMQTLPLRKKNEKLTGGDIRIVEIEGGEMCTCCGTHCNMTGQVGMIKVLEHIKYKQGCRITFACGELALRWFAMENDMLRKTAAKLSVKPDGVPEALQRKEEQISAVHAVLRQKNMQLAAIYTEKLMKASAETENGPVYGGYVPVDTDAAKRIAEQLCEAEPTALAALFCDDGGRYRYFCMAGEKCEKNCRDAAKVINAALSAKGGGNPKTAQGSFEALPADGFEALLKTL
ncbi:MAG: hypothetical protein J6C51_03860 [Clostridia bacterium]|nr:hypothetical protein [Clostridia bacterium]